MNALVARWHIWLAKHTKNREEVLRLVTLANEALLREYEEEERAHAR